MSESERKIIRKNSNLLKVTSYVMYTVCPEYGRLRWESWKQLEYKFG